MVCIPRHGPLTHPDTMLLEVFLNPRRMLGTVATDREPESEHRWAHPICRPRRHPRVTVDCGPSISDGYLGRKERGLSVGQVFGLSNGASEGGGISEEQLQRWPRDLRRWLAPEQERLRRVRQTR